MFKNLLCVYVCICICIASDIATDTDTYWVCGWCIILIKPFMAYLISMCYLVGKWNKVSAFLSQYPDAYLLS